MTPTDPGASSAPGLQYERTVLAWNRTALTAAGLGALLVRVAARDASLLDAVAAGVCLVGATVIRGCGWFRSRRDDPQRPLAVAHTAATLAGLAVLTVLLVHL